MQVIVDAIKSMDPALNVKWNHSCGNRVFSSVCHVMKTSVLLDEVLAYR